MQKAETALVVSSLLIESWRFPKGREVVHHSIIVPFIFSFMRRSGRDHAPDSVSTPDLVKHVDEVSSIYLWLVIWS
jgi:hypothetical protein